MIRVTLLCLAMLGSSFVSMVALAKTPAEQAEEDCDAQYTKEKFADYQLRQLLCMQIYNDKILAAEQERIRQEIKAIRVAQPQPTTPAPASAAQVVPPRSPPARPVPPPPPSVFGDIPIRVIPTPGQLAATAYPIDGDRLWIMSLEAGVKKYVRGVDRVRILVTRDGIPLPIELVHPDGFELVRADLDGDGQIDRKPYSVIDPALFDDLYIPGVEPSSRIVLVYLTPTGKTVLEHGRPPTTLWGRPVRVRYDPPEYVGRFKVGAIDGWRLY